MSTFIAWFALLFAGGTVIGIIHDRVESKHGELMFALLLLVAVVGFK